MANKGMACANIIIDTNAICSNWSALDSLSDPHVETAAVVKTNGYGLDANRIACALYHYGVKSFFVATSEEGASLRGALPHTTPIYIFSGAMEGDYTLIQKYNLIPVLNSTAQYKNFRREIPRAEFAIQLDSGMNRLGMEAHEFMPLREEANKAKLIISHLACADEPSHPQNRAQLNQFYAMTDGIEVRRSLAATNGILLGKEYHFDMCRPGIGLYGGADFNNAQTVVYLKIPVIQTRKLSAGETVGYGATWQAKRDSVIATIAAGYGDGLIRAMGNGLVNLYAHNIPCPLVGRVSMDLLTVDVTDLDEIPPYLEILNEHQTINDLATATDTISHEILTSIGTRYERTYIENIP